MATVSKMESLNAVSLQLTQPASKIVSLVPASGIDSRAASMEMIYQLLLLIGQNMSKIQKANADSSLDQASIAKKMDEATQATTKDQLKQLDAYNQQLAEQQRLGPLFIFVKAFAAVLGAILSVFSCGTAAGLVVALLVIAFTASPLFNMAVGGIAQSLQSNNGVDPEAAKIAADIIMTVIVAVVSFGTEAIAGGIQAASSTAEAGVKLGSEVASKAVYATSASTQAVLQAIFSSNLIADLINEIPGAKKIPLLSALLSILIQIAALIGAGKFSMGSSGESLFQSLSKVSPQLLNKLTPAITAVSAVVEGGSGVGQGVMQIKESDILKAIAPLKAELAFIEGFMQTMTGLTSQTQKTYKSTLENYRNIFDINFSADMQACAQALQG